MSDENEINFKPRVDEPKRPKGYRPLIGIVLAEADYNSCYQFGMPPVDGPIVKCVIPGSLSALAGILPGDMIVEVNGASAKSLPGAPLNIANAVSERINKSSDTVLFLKLRRTDKEIEIKLPL